MGDPPAAAARKPCYVCAEPGGQHCTKCKSRHYCSKAACQMAAEFQDRLLKGPEGAGGYY
ncbi:hypothetical protein M885DRAFT_504136 [Pelagophyceae sp. CCMP2097]|nr:hypothetical protein M885DRAFT_504136 [Pelagophyceae sp. CCMP2097]